MSTAVVSSADQVPRRAPRDGPEALQALRELYEGGYTGIARALGVTRQSVSAWANKRAVPSTESVELLRELGIDRRLRWTRGRR